jgi:hypothetical protein
MARPNLLSRRRFLAIGCGALCAAALGSGCTSQQAQTDQPATCPYGMVNDPYPGRCKRYVDENKNGICDLSERASQDVQEPTSTPTVGAAPSGEQNQGGVICGRGCHYPGHCGRYTDQNGTGICDLSEPA